MTGRAGRLHALTIVALLSIAVSPQPARADLLVLPGNMIGRAILFDRTLDRLSSALEDVGAVYAARAELQADLVSARAAFWGGVDSVEGSEERYAEYVRLLLAKDFLYLSAYLPEGRTSASAQILSRFGGEVDGGIPQGAQAAFEEWVTAIRLEAGLHEGQMLVAGPERLAELISSERSRAAFDAYRLARDRVEFEAAGRLDEFNRKLLELRGESTTVAFDSWRHPEWAQLRFDYRQAPEYFVPEVDVSLLDTDTRSVRYAFFDSEDEQYSPKILIDSLKYMTVTRHPSLRNGADGFDASGRRIELGDGSALEQFLATLPQRPVLLECTYGGSFDWHNLYGWYREAPAFATSPDAARLSSFDFGVLETCPDRFRP